MAVEMIDPNNVSVDITETAQQHLVSQISSTEAKGVRLILKPSGCAGFAYEWQVLNAPEEEDILITQFADYGLYTNDLSKDLLHGSTIDLKQEGIQGSHLEVISPKVVDACGCGESVRFN
jgi:iron-sulfur cluster assembly accessory protein